MHLRTVANVQGLKGAVFFLSLFPRQRESVRTFLFCKKVMLLIQGEELQKAERN